MDTFRNKGEKLRREIWGTYIKLIVLMTLFYKAIGLGRNAGDRQTAKISNICGDRTANDIDGVCFGCTVHKATGRGPRVCDHQRQAVPRP